MKIIEFDINNAPTNDKDLVLCLGFYDGLHLGHQHLIKKALAEGYPVGVMTFDIAPRVLLGKKENYCIMSTFDKADFLEDMGVKYLYLMHFDMETLKVTKDEFINRVLKPLNPRKIFVGDDYRFGTNGEGNADYLKRFFDVEVVPLMKIDNIKVSSKKIREYIEAGQVEKASALLGRPYRISGLVVEGLHNGQKIDFPTANLDLYYPYVFPKDGVYMGYAYFLNRKRKAMICVGTHPTVNQLLKPIIEVHIIDFNEVLYGREIYVDFVSFMRNNKKFDTMEDLKAQLLKDEEKTKNTLQ
ncbi:MAG: bifunctional riboflavin kinase/FAD synthetase [Bacilli bacterium]|nr:bifunctional riboflavin kinase/FAD synthetase [Bacilli bacterium]